MDFEQLQEKYYNDNRIKHIAEALKGDPSARIHLKGITGSADAFIASSIFRLTDKNHIFIFDEKEAAAYFQNDLRTLLPKKDTFYFPDSFKRPGHFEQANNSNILLRTESINHFIEQYTRNEILVTYPEALFEKVVSRNVLRENTLHISTSERLDVDFIIDLLVEYGFERVDFVYEPGEFSIRGGIVDIFSYGNEYPYRVELFGDEVESIRTFDPVTQLSQKKIAKVTIIPNIQTHFTKDEKVDLLELIPENTVIWVKNLQLTKEVLQNLQVKAHTMAEAIPENSGSEKHPLLNSDELAYTPPDIFMEQLSDHPLVEFGDQFSLVASATIAMNISPQPSFNKNFTLLISDLKKNQEAGVTNYIFSDSAKQVERFYQIFEDLDAEVEFYPFVKSIHSGFIDQDLKLACYTDHQIFNRYHKYNIKQSFARGQAVTLKLLRELEPGDYVTHIDHGVGVFSGLEKIEVNGKLQEAVRLIYQDNDLLYVNINSLHKISKFAGKDGKPPRVNKLGSDAWENLKRKTKKKVKDIAKDLIELYAKRKGQPGFQFTPDTYLQTELEASFIYEDTPDQLKAVNDVKEDMEKPHPMDRLVCGDVGFGKTEVAVRAAFKAVADSKQVAILVPTTILAMQHFRTFSSRLDELPCNIDYINRFKTTAQKKDTLARLKEGKIDIIIGTHSLIGKNVKFKDLGLMIIDEEQKFGVAAKERLKKIKLNVDTLTLTATPIPRTLQFSLMGARDLSIINTPPPNRQPINTELHVFNDDILRDAIYNEFYRGGQVFFIHNRVKDIIDVAGMIAQLCPDVNVGVAHGQMEGQKLESEMMKFINHEYDVLVSTNIIEAGLDIPNANTIIINNAHWFGMSDIHQLRGRVGRSNKKAFCYLFSPPLSSLSNDARKRLTVIEQFSELGSGFNIAMKDLDIRGAGNLLGGEQSGFVADIGFETYHKILDETIQELKETDYRDLFSDQLLKQKEFIKDTQIDTDLEILFPDIYIRSTSERLSLYTELNNIRTEEKLQAFREQMKDRFGPVPKETDELFNAIRLQWSAIKLGFERILFKNKKLRCYFISNQDSLYYQSQIFTRILEYVQKHSGKCQLKQTPNSLILIFENVESMEHAQFLLERIVEYTEMDAVASE